MTRVKINLNEGTLEVEGEESFVQAVYNDFKEQLAKGSNRQSSTPSPEKHTTQAQHTPQIDSSPKSTSTTKAKQSSAKSMPSIVKSLDLSSRNGNKSLRDFHAEKSPSNAMENNALFVYHLKNNLELDQIGIDHIYTCYKEVSVKPPTALRQSLIDTANRKGWVDTSSLDNITLSLRGENFIDHDLPRKTTKK